MNWTLLWIMLFFLLFFFGIFIMVFFSSRAQGKALNTIILQQKAMCLELDRLAGRLDNLLAEREVLEDGYLLPDPPDRVSAMPHRPVEEMVPGIKKLLLTKPTAAKDPHAQGMPEIKI